MASQLGYSEWNKNVSNITTKTKNRRNKTLKKRSTLDKDKIESFLNSMNNETETLGGDLDENNLADFEPTKKHFRPPPNAELTKVPNNGIDNSKLPEGVTIPELPEELKKQGPPNDDMAVTPEGFEQMKSKYNAKNYNDNYIPYFNNPSNNAVYNNRDDLMKKLNYLIHMMEEQKDEKTQNVTEELVLYLFLGVFMIFTIDSFARASKYTR